MDLSDEDVQQFAEADRRELDPPIEVQAATWSPGGQLDWWVKDRQEWWGRCGAKTAVNGGSELLIFVRRATRSRELLVPSFEELLRLIRNRNLQLV
jgi:hypothetical protein